MRSDYFGRVSSKGLENVSRFPHLYAELMRPEFLRARYREDRGNRNACKHGARSAEALALKREIRALARIVRETMAAIE
jgi:hypothetical protein